MVSSVVRNRRVQFELVRCILWGSIAYSMQVGRFNGATDERYPEYFSVEKAVSHTIRDKKKLLNRIRRIAGQVAAIEHGLETEQDASAVLQNIAACRGAMNGLLAEVIEGHIEHHIIDPAQRPTPAQVEAAHELVDIVRAYLK